MFVWDFFVTSRLYIYAISIRETLINGTEKSEVHVFMCPILKSRCPLFMVVSKFVCSQQRSEKPQPCNRRELLINIKPICI